MSTTTSLRYSITASIPPLCGGLIKVYTYVGIGKPHLDNYIKLRLLRNVYESVPNTHNMDTASSPITIVQYSVLYVYHSYVYSTSCKGIINTALCVCGVLCNTSKKTFLNKIHTVRKCTYYLAPSVVHAFRYSPAFKFPLKAGINFCPHHTCSRKGTRFRVTRWVICTHACAHARA